MSVILDTTVLIDPIEFDDDEDYAISVVSIAELQFGVLRAAGSPHQASRLQRLSMIENAYDVIPMDAAIARAYAECAAAVAGSGRNPRSRVFDLVIAATAKVRGAALLTYNVDDFRGIAHLVEVRDARVERRTEA